MDRWRGISDLRFQIQKKRGEFAAGWIVVARGPGATKANTRTKDPGFG